MTPKSDAKVDAAIKAYNHAVTTKNHRRVSYWFRQVDRSFRRLARENASKVFPLDWYEWRLGEKDSFEAHSVSHLPPF